MCTHDEHASRRHINPKHESGSVGVWRESINGLMNNARVYGILEHMATTLNKEKQPNILVVALFTNNIITHNILLPFRSYYNFIQF